MQSLLVPKLKMACITSLTYMYIEAYTVYLAADKEGSVMPSIKTSSNDTV